MDREPGRLPVRIRAITYAGIVVRKVPIETPIRKREHLLDCAQSVAVLES
jgi:hypothetical protein